MRAIARLAAPFAVDVELAAATPCVARFDFHGHLFEARSTSPGWIDHLTRIYRFFRRDIDIGVNGGRDIAGYVVHADGGGAARALLERRLRVPRALDGELLAFAGDERCYLVAGATLARYYGSKLLRLRVVAAHAAEAVTLHAAAVAPAGGGRGALLIGEAAAGKTTLCLRLIERGLGYCADDTAPVRRRDLMALPFPMPLLARAMPDGQAPPWAGARPPDIVLLDEPRWMIERWREVAAPFRPTRLFFCRDHGPLLEPLTPLAAVLELQRNVVFPLGARAEEAILGDLDTLIALAEGASAHWLNSSSGAAAVDAVAEASA